MEEVPVAGASHGPPIPWEEYDVPDELEVCAENRFITLEVGESRVMNVELK